MRNRYASGGMVEVDNISAPTATVDAETVPLTGSYAFKDGDKYAIFVLSRKVAGQALGSDLGDGFTPVTLNLPFGKATKITQYYLTGAPSDSNLDEEKVKLQSRDIPVDSIDAKRVFTINDRTGGGVGGIPPGTAFLYVFEGTK